MPTAKGPRFGVVTLFPDMVAGALRAGVVGRAIERGLVGLELENPRDHAHDAHRTVDDRPFGGGPGMVMKPGPLVAAVRALQGRLGAATVVCLSPQGRRFDQAMARTWSRTEALVLIAGRYEGIDERVIDAVVDQEVSLGDFVLSGGEFAALAMIDATARLVPGALGHAGSAGQDSFGAGGAEDAGGLDCPHWTRPVSFEGRTVPEVLLSGDHARIRAWRAEQARSRTRARRPDLLGPVGAMTNDDERASDGGAAGTEADRTGP